VRSKNPAPIFKYILIALLIALSYWLLETLIETYIFDRDDFIHNLFSPRAHEAWMRSTTGAILLLLALYVLLRENRNREDRLILRTLRDLRDKRAREERESELILSKNIFRHTLEGILITDTDGKILRVNPSFSEITGYSPEEAIGKTPRMLKSEHHDHEFYKGLWKRLLQTGSWEGEIWNRKKSGEAYPEWLSITTLRDEEGKPQNFLSMFHDISEKKMQEKRLEQLAYHDGLTNLPNRKLFMDRMKMALASSSRGGETTAVLFIDIDDFKNINDTLGHPAGDQLLVQVKEKIISIDRKSVV